MSSPVASPGARSLRPSQQLPPQEHAQEIYASLRELPLDRAARPSHEQTLDAFPEAPIEIARLLVKLATADSDSERRWALEELSQVLADTGTVSKVRFKGIPPGTSIKYRPLAERRVRTATEGENHLAIGFYEVWAERDGKPVSEKHTFDILGRKVTIRLPLAEKKPDASTDGE